MRWPALHVWHEDQGFRKTIIATKPVAAARADYLVFVDGDCILHRKFLESHFRHRARGCCACRQAVTLDRHITEKLTSTTLLGRLESRGSGWNHCERSERKHGLYFPLLQRFRT